MSWIEPIYDRTQYDIEYAKSRIKYFKQNGGITDGVELKGCLNCTDLNRIENNIEYLSELLNELYYCNTIDKRDAQWSMDDIPTKTNIERILNNLNELLIKYYTLDEALVIPETLTHFEAVNIVEKCIYLIKVMIDDMVTSFRECGTFNCGEEW